MPPMFLSQQQGQCMFFMANLRITLLSSCVPKANYYTQTIPNPRDGNNRLTKRGSRPSHPLLKAYDNEIQGTLFKTFLKKIFYIYFLIMLAGIMPAFADAGDDDKGIEDNRTFHVYDDVDLVSTLKFSYGKPNIIIKSVYPQLASETMRDGIDNFNELAMAIVQDEINQFRAKVKDYSFAQKTLPRTKITNNLYIDYNTSYIKSKHDHIISIRFTIQGFITGISQPYHHHRVINYNLDTSQEIELSDLFLPGSNYLALLSNYTSARLNRHLRNKDAISYGTAPMPGNYQIWNIKPNGLLITFEESQVAPRIQGAQTIFVPYSVLREIASPDSPVAACILHKKRCSSTHLLTGGFIDEATKSNPQKTKFL